jgi:hypothetical protein
VTWSDEKFPSPRTLGPAQAKAPGTPGDDGLLKTQAKAPSGSGGVGLLCKSGGAAFCTTCAHSRIMHQLTTCRHSTVMTIS